jgi:hypothetical protein
MANSIQNGVYGSALSERDTSLSDKYFGGTETSDFGLDGSSTATTTDASIGIKASDYLGDSADDSSSTSDMFSGVSLGSIASAVKGVASIYDSYNKKQYQDKIFGMEEKRVARQTAKEDKAQAALESAWS